MPCQLFYALWGFLFDMFGRNQALDYNVGNRKRDRSCLNVEIREWTGIAADDRMGTLRFGIKDSG
jgi:hypothetical protein